VIVTDGVGHWMTAPFGQQWGTDNPNPVTPISLFPVVAIPSPPRYALSSKLLLLTLSADEVVNRRSTNITERSRSCFVKRRKQKVLVVQWRSLLPNNGFSFLGLDSASRPP
jgi:hypothetical protein